MRTGLVLLFAWLAVAPAWAGGSGLNTVVVVNQASTNSVELGNYFAEKRQVPPENVVRISWPGDRVSWTTADYQSYLLNPLLIALTARGISNQVDYVVLSMDIPYRLTQDGPATESGVNTTTSTLFYGFKPDYDPNFSLPGYPGCSLPAVSSNSYAGSEGIFRAIPVSTNSSWLTMMITSSNLASAKAIVDRGVASDGTQPNAPIILSRTTDAARSVRFQSFDDAILNFRVRGRTNLVKDTAPTPLGYSNLLGLSFGGGYFSVSPNTFIPGAMADHLTSYGGYIFMPNSQTTVIEMLNAGATASYGTVVEPCNYVEKFPSSMAYFYQLRGFSIAESYYQSVANPYQGLTVGEPLAAPYSRWASGGWSGVASNAVLTGTANLNLAFTAASPRHPLQQVDLFVDGKLAQTLTNIPPRAQNVLNVTLNGRAMSYTVAAGETIGSVAAGLAAELNQNANANVTKVRALTRGDRVELQSLDFSRSAAQVTLSAGTAQGSASALTTFLHAEGTNFVESSAKGYRGLLVSNTPPAGGFVRLTFTKTNGAVVMVSATNTGGMTASALTETLINRVNAEPLLQGPDGVTAEDLFGADAFGMPYAEFNVWARSPGWAAAQLQVQIAASPGIVVAPGSARDLVTNPSDMYPRQHLYVTAGVTNLGMGLALNTATLANGYHTLAAVAYEGSHVRTQTRSTVPVVVQNGGITATLSLVSGGANVSLGSTLSFQVNATGGSVSRTELFSTGGSVGVVSNSASAGFAVATDFLGVGLHPFYAVVTPVSGVAYRTETQWVRVTPAFTLTALGNPVRITWPATAGTTYTVWSGPTPTEITNLRATVTASNSVVTWVEPSPGASAQFYRVSLP